MFKQIIIALHMACEKLQYPRSGNRPPLQGLLLVLVLMLPMALQATDDKELKARESELARLRDSMHGIESEIRHDRALRSSESRKLRETEQAIAAHAEVLRELASSIARQSKETRRLKAQHAQALKALSRQRELLASQLRASYQGGRQEKVKLLLNQGDPARIGRMLGYHDYLARSRVEHIQQVNQQALALRELETTLAQRVEELHTLQAVQQGQIAQLEAARKERGLRLSKLEAEINASGKALERMRAERGALENLITAIRKRLTEIPAAFRNSRPLSQSEGRLPWPVKGHLLAHYGQAKQGTSLHWNGIWIAAKAGTPVRAVAEGRVVYVGWLHRYGLLVITEHPDGYYSLYGHNQQAVVEVGAATQAGQVIAYTGDSGGHAKTGLYFELRKGKDPINPMRWLAGK